MDQSRSHAQTLNEILQLPLRSFNTRIGDPGYPGPYNFDEASRNDRVRFYFEDTWRATRNLTIKYGLAYSLETNLFDVQLKLFGEVFNLFNVANLTGFADLLNQPNYGQPSSRVGQAFGTGGPRAFQFGARLEF